MVGNPELDTINTPEISPELQSLQTPDGELHLRFYLPSQDEFALPATAISKLLSQKFKII